MRGLKRGCNMAPAQLFSKIMADLKEVPARLPADSKDVTAYVRVPSAFSLGYIPAQGDVWLVQSVNNVVAAVVQVLANPGKKKLHNHLCNAEVEIRWESEFEPPQGMAVTMPGNIAVVQLHSAQYEVYLVEVPRGGCYNVNYEIDGRFTLPELDGDDGDDAGDEADEYTPDAAEDNEDDEDEDDSGPSPAKGTRSKARAIAGAGKARAVTKRRWNRVGGDPDQEDYDVDMLEVEAATATVGGGTSNNNKLDIMLTMLVKVGRKLEDLEVAMDKLTGEVATLGSNGHQRAGHAAETAYGKAVRRELMLLTTHTPYSSMADIAQAVYRGLGVTSVDELVKEFGAFGQRMKAKANGYVRTSCRGEVCTFVDKNLRTHYTRGSGWGVLLVVDGKELSGPHAIDVEAAAAIATTTDAQFVHTSDGHFCNPAFMGLLLDYYNNWVVKRLFNGQERASNASEVFMTLEHVSFFQMEVYRKLSGTKIPKLSKNNRAEVSEDKENLFKEVLAKNKAKVALSALKNKIALASVEAFALKVRKAYQLEGMDGEEDEDEDDAQ